MKHHILKPGVTSQEVLAWSCGVAKVKAFMQPEDSVKAQLFCRRNYVISDELYEDDCDDQLERAHPDLDFEPWDELEFLSPLNYHIVYSIITLTLKNDSKNRKEFRLLLELLDTYTKNPKISLIPELQSNENILYPKYFCDFYKPISEEEIFWLKTNHKDAYLLHLEKEEEFINMMREAYAETVFGTFLNKMLGCIDVGGIKVAKQIGTLISRSKNLDAVEQFHRLAMNFEASPVLAA